jgi:hypothetical protein
MMSRLSTLLLSGLLGLLASGQLVADEIVITFSKEDELKTGLRWIDLRPEVIRPTALAAESVSNSGALPKSGLTNLRSQPPVNHGETAVGKLLFVTPGGAAGSCTATFVAGKSTLLTAARCIMDRSGQRNSDFVFLTSYGSPAQQLYPISCAVVPQAWTTEEGAGGWAHNVAFLRTSRDSTFGGLGVTNAFPPKNVARVGFTDAVGEGRQMQLSTSGAFMTTNKMVGSLYDLLSAGSSGNPWIRNSIVHSISSHYDPALPTVLLGPRFTGATMKLLARAKNDC